MDVVFEWLVQVVLEIVSQLLAELAFQAVFKGLATALASRIARYVMGALAGLGFGLYWGDHLSGNPHYPRLLWVSLVLGAVAAALAVGASTAEPTVGPWRRLLQPPWTWTRDRFLGFVFINAGIAIGIVISFHGGA